MKLAKEARVGLLGLVSLVVLYLGFNFLKGSDLFSTENEYKVIFQDVQGLQNSNAVTFNGVVVGRVMALETDQKNNRINVTLAVRKKIDITDQTIALLADDGLIGGKLIKLQILPGKSLPEGGEIKGEIQQGLADAAMEQISPSLKNVDSLVLNLTKIVKQFDQTGYAMKALMGSANKTTDGVNLIVAKNAENLAKITTNAAILTQNLNTLASGLDAKMAPILKQTGDFTQNLSSLELDKTIGSLNTSIASLQNLLNNVNNGKGTLGKLTSDDSLYVNLDNTAASLDALLSDMKDNPKRYVHFSLFGGKKKEVKE
jgi:phospholipid/cholesterol/gamma-HCH transport system substrate-binding protein